MNLMLTRTPAEDALGVTLPSRRDEDWKWTDLRRMISGVYTRQSVVANAADVDRLIKSSPFASVKARRIVFVNGAIDAQRSQLDGLIVENQLPALVNDETVVAMNSALAAQGVTLRFEGNADTPGAKLHRGCTRSLCDNHRDTSG
jgi:Fe-S cluster assembly protein SufD